MAHCKKPYEKNSRAQKRTYGEDAFKIRAPSSLRNYSGRKVRNENQNYVSGSGCFTTHHDGTDFNTSWRSDISKKDMGNRFFNPMQSVQRLSNNPNHELRLHGFNPGSHQNHTMEFGKGNMTTNGNSKSSITELDKHPVDLIISNLDSSIAVGDLKRLLANMLKDYAMISTLKVTIQVDGTACAHIRVSSQQEAQFAISQLHRQKLGQKRIIISYAQNNVVCDPEHLKGIVVSILQETPDKKMVLFKFLSLMQVKYQWTLSISEVSKLKDVCKITEEQGCRIISLTEEVKSSPVSGLNKNILSYCSTHCPNGLQTGGWCEFDAVQLPNVKVSLKFFAEKVYNLLDTHMNSLPIMSFQTCYEQTFKLPLPVSDDGVALEHLISCLPDIAIKSVEPNKNIKIIKREDKKSNDEEESFLKGVPPVLASSISLLCRELVDFLRTMNKCQLLLSKFIPAYHHHFGRQCRVADYGFTKLIDLFESIPHVVQIIGYGTRRMITLSHSAQMRRFTSDLLKVLKVQPCRQISLTDFPSAYMKIMNKPFSPIDYGLCTLEDLLAEIPDSVVVVTKKGDVTIIDVPRKEQTPKEIAKTLEFSKEVVELLRHSPYCTLVFYEFIPAYHHHFGHQCKVADYGFTKLIELFEAIPDVVKIVKLPDGERAVSLTLPKMLHVLGCEILSMIKYYNVSAIFLTELPMFYLRKYGYLFKPHVYECENVQQVIADLSDYVQLIQTTSDPYVVPLDNDPMHILKMRVWSLLLDPPYCMKISNFKYDYQSRFNCHLTEENLNDLEQIISISHSNNISYVSLSKLYILAAQIYRVLYNNKGHSYFNDIEVNLYSLYKIPIKLEDYSILSANDLVRCYGFMLYLSGNAQNSLVSLRRKLSDHQIPIPELLSNAIGNIEENQREWLSNINYNRKFAPPKPNSPPSPGTTLYWNSPTGTFKFSDFSIQMPSFNSPKLNDKDLKDLISPDSQIFLPENTPSFWFDSDVLEVPGKLTSKGVMSDDSSDSGVNSKLDISPPDSDYLGSSLSKNFEAMEADIVETELTMKSDYGNDEETTKELNDSKESQNSSENELDFVLCLTEELSVEKYKQLIHKYYLKSEDLENKCTLLHQKLIELKNVWDETKKSRDEIKREKEQMIIKFATCERIVITERKAKEKAEKHYRELTKENDILQHKLQTMTEEKNRLTCMYDSKIYEQKTTQSENESIKNENCILQNELKLCQIALRKHVDLQKTNQQNIENLNKKVTEYAAQMEQVKRSSEECIKSFKSSEENEAFSLSKQVKELQASLILLKHDKDAKDEQLRKIQINLDKLQLKNEELSQNMDELSRKKDELESYNAKYAEEIARLKDHTEERLKIIEELQQKIEQLKKLELELENNKEQLNICNENLSLSKSINGDLETEVKSLRLKETESLLFLQRLTEKTVELQSEVMALKIKYDEVLDENMALRMDSQNLKNENSSLRENEGKLLEEKKINSDEIRLLKKTLSKQKNQIVALEQGLHDQKAETEIISRKSRLLMRELKKEVFQYRNIEDVKSYASSCTSFASTRPDKRQNSCSNVKIIQPDCVINPQILIERLVKLQRISARKSEKIDFLEDHVNLLVEEIKKKSSLLQKYMLREKCGVLTSEQADRTKTRFAKMRGIMASVYGVKFADRRLTMELLLDINRKLQAILEDALLENIILKKNIDTLGFEIDKLNARKNFSNS